MKTIRTLLIAAAALLLQGPIATAHPGPLLDKPQVAEADQLFDSIFGGEEKERNDYWDAEARALCSSGYTHNEAGREVYIENVWQLAQDGMVLRKYSRERFKGAQRFVNHTCKVDHAVYPFIFAEALRLIVDRADERIDFEHWQMDAANRELLRVQVKLFNLDKAEVIEERTSFERK